MKKLIIAASIVCAAAFAQAASFYWGVNNSSIMGPGTVADGYVDEYGYLLDATAQLIVDGNVIATAPSINEDYTFGPVYTAKAESDDLTALARGEITYTPKDFQIILTTLDGKYSTTISDASHFESEAAGIGEPSFNYEAFVTTKDAGDWVAAPEPTSGLLLLIGVAGLALRRRRA